MIPFNVKFDNEIVDIACGNDFSVFLDSKSTMYVTGNNENQRFLLDSRGLLSLPEKFNIEVKKISSQSNFILFILKDNKVMATGNDLHK